MCHSTLSPPGGTNSFKIKAEVILRSTCVCLDSKRCQIEPGKRGAGSRSARSPSWRPCGRSVWRAAPASPVGSARSSTPARARAQPFPDAPTPATSSHQHRESEKTDAFNVLKLQKIPCLYYKFAFNPLADICCFKHLIMVIFASPVNFFLI